MKSPNHLIPFVGRAHQRGPRILSYRVTDRLNSGHAARVSVDGIASTVTAWLAELGADSPMVDDLARAVCCGDWPAAHALADHLSVDVVIAA
jgi:hypothetical protein